MANVKSVLRQQVSKDFHRVSAGEQIDIRKRMAKIIGDSRSDAKIDRCYYCRKPVEGFCNSHSIPAYSLRNIATEGKLYHSNTFVEFDFMDYEKGLNNAGTFKLICRDCDSRVFSEYENPQNYGLTLSSRLIAQIAMKNYLKNISKRYIEQKLYAHMLAMGLSESAHAAKQEVHGLDLKEFIDGYEKAKRVSMRNSEGEYYVFFRRTLNYVAPLAFQDSITLVVDIEGNIVNDIYCMDSGYHTKEVHVCVFPMENTTEVIMFIDSNDKIYRRFYKQLRKLSPEDQLHLITYIIFIYAEDVFFSKDINPEILHSKALKEASKESTEMISDSPFVDPLSVVRKSYDLDKRHNIPNILAERYKLR